jgi:hypothetical protein
MATLREQLRARREAACPCARVSITSSAATSRPDGTAKPRSFAVLRLRAVSNLVGVCTGRSLGLAPRNTRSTYGGLAVDEGAIGVGVEKIGREVGVKPGDIGLIHGTDVVAIELLQSRVVQFGVGHSEI